MAKFYELSEENLELVQEMFKKLHLLLAVADILLLLEPELPTSLK
jgi:hypothetical protein